MALADTSIARLGALAARLAAHVAQERPPVGEVAPVGADRWLTPQEAAGIAQVGVRWLYRHADQIPGARRFSRRCLRFHEPAFRRWLRKGLDSSPRRPLLSAGEPS